MKRTEPGWLVLTLAGFAALLGSFLPFYTYAEGVDVTVWSRGLFPTAALIPLLGFVIGLQALFVLVVGHEPRSPFLNFTWEQVRLAAGAFMILLALSYLLQDRAGGNLGSGYLVLSLASLVTFAGGVMTRRAYLARAGEAAPARKRQLQPKPAFASVSRVSAGLARNVGAFGRSAARSTATFGRSAARGTAALGRNVGAHLGLGEPNEAKQQEATLYAKLDGRLDVQPTATPTEKIAEPPPETGAEEPIEATADAPAEPVAKVADEPVEEQIEATAEKPIEEVPEEPVEATAEKPVETVTDELVEATAEKPVEVVADEPTEEIATESARVATLSAGPPEAEPDETAAPDGDAPPPTRESPAGGDKVAASKPTRKRPPAKKMEKKVETKEPAGTGQEPQSPAAPG
jgi:hypothetical protein